MRNLFTISLVFVAFIVNAQITTGQLTIQNMGTYYEIKKDNVVPKNNSYPYPDSASLVVTVLSLNPIAWEVNNIKVTDVLKYELNGNIIISSSIIWWRQGQKKSQTSMKTICITGSNPVSYRFKRL